MQVLLGTEKRLQVRATRIAASLLVLLEAENVAIDRPGVEAGLALLEADGDFADGIIAYDGQWLDGETSMSFDTVAVKLLAARDYKALVSK